MHASGKGCKVAVVQGRARPIHPFRLGCGGGGRMRFSGLTGRGPWGQWIPTLHSVLCRGGRSCRTMSTRVDCRAVHELWERACIGRMKNCEVHPQSSPSGANTLHFHRIQPFRSTLAVETGDTRKRLPDKHRIRAMRRDVCALPTTRNP